jgi:hypothetical protein
MSIFAKPLVLGGLLALGLAALAGAQEPEDGGGGAAAMARQMQDPLANIKALITDNAIGFQAGDGNPAYGFQLQPIYAIDLPERGFTLLPRAVIPFMGIPPESEFPKLGQPRPAGGGTVWGLGDIILQTFVAPKTKGSWKWGIGPQVSLSTHTDPFLRGPDWGAGAVGVVTGGVGENISVAGIIGNLWSFDGQFNSMIIQPMVFYNIAALPGAYFGYNAPIGANWKASSSDIWTVPLGISVGKTFDMGKGNGLDLMIGPYYNVVRPDGGAEWSLRFGINWMFP